MKLAWPALMLVAFTCAGCKYSAAPYYGQLVVGDQRGIILVQLPSTDETLLLSTAESNAVYGHPTLVEPGVLIFSSAQRLVKFDLRTKKLVDLGEGVWPTYVPEHHLLFFWKGREGSKQPRDRVVRVRSVNGPPNEKVVTYFSDVWNSRIVQISSDEVALYGPGNRVWKYSITSSTLSQTGIERCLPMAWRNKTRQLICKNVDDHKTYLASLNGEAIAIPIQSYEVLGYSPSYDAVIYDAAYGAWWNFTVGWAIAAYNFRNRKTVRLTWTKPGATAILLDRDGEPL